MSRPVIAVSMGDPAGIGPEVVVRAAAVPEVTQAARVVVAGDGKILEKALEITGVPLSIREITDPGQGDYRQGVINLINLSNVDSASFRFGEVSGPCGRAAYEYIQKCTDLALSGKADAVATAPVNKESLRAGGVPYIGHTEIFGALTGTADPLTMFETGGLRIFFLTRHVSLREMLELIKKENIKDTARRCLKALERLGVRGGTLAVAGLNPHCGEHGLFGLEEVEEITPAVLELQQEGLPVAGPVGADSVFHQAASGKYAAVLSLYHDQGHIAAKTLDFERTISITCGMPILRTSVDHGTAFDIAGKNLADETGMVEAILAAARYASCFKRN